MLSNSPCIPAAPGLGENIDGCIIGTTFLSCRDEYLFNFDNTFEIHDDIEVLKRMGMTFGLEKGQCSQADLNKSLKMVPKALEPYVLGESVRGWEDGAWGGGGGGGGGGGE